MGIVDGTQSPVRRMRGDPRSRSFRAMDSLAPGLVRAARRATGSPLSDALLALLLAIAGEVQMLGSASPSAVSGALVLVMTIPLALRRRRPLLVAVLISAAGLAYTLARGLNPSFVGAVLAALMAYYAAAAYERDVRRALIGFAAGLVAFWGSDARLSHAGSEYLASFVLVAGPWVAGRALRGQRLQAGRLRSLAHHLDRERERDAHAAVIAERARISRELHDVTAHAMSVIAVQADAAEAVLDLRPALAREPLIAIRETARNALGDMRRLLDVLRETEGQESLEPQPGLGRLPELVEQAREAGMPVELHADRIEGSLSPGLDLAGYRIVQEALTNVLKHAGPVPTRVAVRCDTDAIELRVDNAPGQPHPSRDGPPGAGHGLTGIRERAALYRGHAEAGPTRDGGWRVTARLPVGDQRA